MRPSFLDSIRPWCVLAVVGLLLLVQLASAGAAPQSAQTLPPVEAPVEAIHKSTFLNDTTYGKDPFFPRSVRREAKAPVAEAKPIEIAVEGLELKGLSGNSPNRLAIINNRTFAVGEEQSVKLHDRQIPVRCVEIRDSSVIISVGGLTRELHFRKKP